MELNHSVEFLSIVLLIVAPTTIYLRVTRSKLSAGDVTSSIQLLCRKLLHRDKMYFYAPLLSTTTTQYNDECASTDECLGAEDDDLFVQIEHGRESDIC